MTYGLDMTSLSHDLLGPGLATVLLVFMTYLAGRVHQYFKQTEEREEAYRDGYNMATRSLFGLATRVAANPGTRRAVQAQAKPMVGYASVPDNQRHPLPARHRAQGRRTRNLADTKQIAAQQ